MRYIGCIPVEDAGGARFDVHAYVKRRFLRVQRRFVLDGGEPVRRMEDGNFVVDSTGETLVSVELKDAWPSPSSRASAGSELDCL